MKQFCSKHLIAAMGLLFFVTACTEERPPVFSHSMPQGPTPWLHEKFDDQEGQFTFAIVSDLNGGERKGVFDVAIEQLNLLRPELILSVGDLVEGGTENRDTMKIEYDRFDERAGRAKAPLFHVGGNHDLTNPMMRKFWKDRYGATYYYFIYKNVLFLMLDSEDYNETRMQEIYLARAAAIKVLDGDHPEKAQEMEYFKMPERVSGEISKKQSAYFSEVIQQHPDVRWTFLFMHKPVWKREDDGGLALIEKALADRHHTVFNGHFHNYEYTEKNKRDYIILGTTGGSQNPKSDQAFDHVTLITMSSDGPSIANLRLGGILDKAGHVPLGGDSLCFQASACK